MADRWPPRGYERAYTLVGDERVLDGVLITEDQARTVHTIFSLRDDGETLRGIANMLNSANIRTQRNGR